MYLSGDRQRFDFLCFDLDASRGNTVSDATRLTHWMDAIGIPYLVCISGPSGGRHVWVRLAEPLDAALVRPLAQLAGQLLPSLDPTPLMNPATGCVRPPGAPHRAGTGSIPLSDPWELDGQMAEPDRIADLQELFVSLGAELPIPDAVLPHGVSVDDDGHPHLPGRRRALSARITALLHEPLADGEDASRRLATVLAACANAHWQYRDLRALHSSAAFEHVRTQHVRAGVRTDRSAHGQERVLRNVWRSAVTFCAQNPATAAGDDPEFARRARTTVAAVDAVLDRVRRSPGRLSLAERSVLECVALFMLQGVTTTVETNIRRIALQTGWGKTQVAVTLTALVSAGWLERGAVPEGPHGQTYRLPEKFSTAAPGEDRTQAHARPLAHRDLLTRKILTRLEPLAHDAFAAPRSLGRRSGAAYAALGDMPTPLPLSSGLEALERAGLARRSGSLWERTSRALETVAETLGVAGWIDKRRARYEMDRQLWAWWRSEERWMRQRAPKRGRHSPTGQSSLIPVTVGAAWPRYPRRGGRGDHRQARALIGAQAV